MAEQTDRFVPAFPHIRLDGEPWLAGSRCSSCGATVPGARLACPSCGRRDTIEEVRLGERGTLYNYTIVHRSYPGVPTPFVSAIVDLEGGGSLKGTLVGVEPDPDKLPRDMAVNVAFRDTGQKNKEGNPFLCYYFTPAEGSAA